MSKHLLLLLLFHSSNNMIMQVSPETFKNQKKLKELHLAENNISNISSNTFVGLSNLIVSFCKVFL